MEKLPKVFVFCNNKGCDGSGDWHPMFALSEDGHSLAGHMCSSHGWARNDMGINKDGWKRDLYSAHYPNGFDVVWVERPESDADFLAAIAIVEKRAPQAAA